MDEVNLLEIGTKLHFFVLGNANFQYYYQHLEAKFSLSG